MPDSAGRGRRSRDGAQRILNVAVDLFARQGYVGTGIRDIAQEAGISSSSLYNHFSNKEKILVKIMQNGFEELTGRARQVITESDAADEQLTALVRQHVRFETDQQHRARVMTVEFRFLSTSARTKVVPVRDAYERVWDEVIGRGVQQRVFEVGDPQMARLGLLGMCAGPGRWYWPEGHINPDVVADKFAGMALNVVRAATRTPRA